MTGDAPLLVATALAVTAVTVDAPRAGGRARSLIPARRAATGSPSDRRHGDPRTARAAGAGGAAVLAHVVLGDAFGAPALVWSALAGCLAWWVLGRLEPAAVRRRRERVVADLPFAVELTAGCLAAGASVDRALVAAGAAVGGPAGEAFVRAGSALGLGASAHEALASWRHDPALAALMPFARLLGRSLDTGTALVPAATRFAHERRAAARWEADAVARRVGVRATVPLGLCFLPAFVLLGIVPAVLAGARALAL